MFINYAKLYNALLQLQYYSDEMYVTVDYVSSAFRSKLSRAKLGNLTKAWNF